MTSKVLIGTASWEQRYGQGMLDSLNNGTFDQVIILYSTRFAELTCKETEKLQKICEQRGIEFRSWGFDFENQVEVLRKVEKIFGGSEFRTADAVVFDISTTPRPIVWSTLDTLKQSRESVTIRYYAGESYGKWQTNEEGEPRLILRRSGIMYPDQPTALVLLCGPEISRAEKMCFHFEPKSVHILRDPRAGAFGEVKSLPAEYRSISREIEFDNKDMGEENICYLDDVVGQLLECNPPNNVVAAALGPKLGALLLYKLTQKRAEVGLGYVVSGRHNPTATKGLGERTDIELRLE